MVDLAGRFERCPGGRVFVNLCSALCPWVARLPILCGLCGTFQGGLAMGGTEPDGGGIRLHDPSVREWISLRGLAEAEAALVAGPQAEPGAGRIRITAGLPGLVAQPAAHAGRLYTRLEAPGWTWLNEPGKPAVPVKHFLLPIPVGVAPRVSVRSLVEVGIEGLEVEPAQPLPLESGPGELFARDAATYASGNPYPASQVVAWSVGRIRNQGVLSLAVAPVRALPGRRAALAAVELEVEVAWGPAGVSAASTPPPPEPVETMPEGTSGGAPIPYLVVLPDQFAGNARLAEWVDWKRRKGCAMRLVRTSQISPDGAPSPEAVTKYLRGLPAAEYPEYLLILGDANPVRGVDGRPISRTLRYEGRYDLDYACRDAADIYPDLAYGRLPAADDRQLTAMLAKCLAADRTPPEGDMYQKVAVAAMLEDKTPRDNRADKLFCETADAVAAYFEQAPGGVVYGCTRAFVNPYAVTSQCYWNQNSLLWRATDQIGSRVWDHFLPEEAARERLAGAINAGVSLVLHRDHGNPDGWIDPPFTSADIRRLANGERRPLVLSMNCLTGSYMYDNNFAAAWLLHEGGGAYAVVASVDASTSWCNDWMTHGFLAGLLPDYLAWHNQSTQPDWPKDLPAPGGAYGQVGSRTRLGPLLNFAKMYMLEQNRYVPSLGANLDTFRIFQVFGDPETHVLLPRPRPLAATLPPALSPGSQRVQVATGEPGSQVCLYGPDVGVHQVAIAGADGQAALAVAPTDPGIIHVTVTAYGCRPFEGALMVKPSAGQPPVIAAQPVSQAVLAGGEARLEVAAEGPAPLNWQWRQDGTNVAGATAARLSLPGVRAVQAGNYSVVVSNPFGAITSAVAVLTVVVDGASRFRFARPEAINIVDDAAADPYPSRLLVAGVVGVVTNVSVTLSNLSHPYSGDVAVLLVSPAGQRVVLLSKSGGSFGATNATLVFDQQMGNMTGQNAPLVSGGFRPSDWANYAENGGFPAPAPDGISSTNLLDLAGHDPNGEWSLYVWDAERGDSGIIQNGWSLDLDTDPLGMLAPVVIREPEPVTVFAGARAELSAGVTGAAPIAYAWLKEGLPVGGGCRLAWDPATLAQAGVYTLVASNRYGVATSLQAVVQVLPPGPLATALDNPALDWSTYGSAAWAGQTAASQDGVGAARSGRVGNGGESHLKTTVAGPGWVTFWWRVSSEEGYDFLRFTVGGQAYAAISGETAWAVKTLHIPPGQQTLQWSYLKDYSFSGGQDAGWVDQVAFTPTLGLLDHFTWDLAGGDPQAGIPFAARLEARDESENLVANPGSTPAIRGAAYGTAANLLGEVSPQQTGTSGEMGYTDGFSFTPGRDLLVTHFRTYHGAKVSLWQEDGGLLASQAVAATGSAWAESPLPAPVSLLAGRHYRLGVFNPASLTAYYLTNLPAAFADGSIGQSWFSPDDNYPEKELRGARPLVDMLYLPVVPAGVKVTPGSAVLAGGIWEGMVTVSQAASRLRLWADDGAGHAGYSQFFNVVADPTLRPPAITIQPLDQMVTEGAAVIFTVGAMGSAPLTFAWLRNGVAIPGASQQEYRLARVLLADAGARFSCVASNPAGSATSLAAVLTVNPAPPTLAQALDNATLAWSTRGDMPWFAQAGAARDGLAAQSGFIGDKQVSVLETFVAGPGTVSFWWRVSSEQDYDILSFWLDEKRLARISGEADWSRLETAVPAGMHVLHWEYSKDVDNKEGLDAGWVDRVQFAAGRLPWLEIAQAAPALVLRAQGAPGSEWTLQTASQVTGPWVAGQRLILPNAPVLIPVTNLVQSPRFFRLGSP